MAKCNLILTKRSHQRPTCNNTPGYIPAITRDEQPNIIPDYASRNHNVTKNYTLQCSPRLIANTPAKRKVTFIPILGSIASKARSRIIIQQALNAMTMKEALYPPAAFSLSHLTMPAFVDKIPNYAHYASLMVHPTTGETFISYKRLMNGPKTAKIWQTAFGKDFGGMARSEGHKLNICTDT